MELSAALRARCIPWWRSKAPNRCEDVEESKSTVDNYWAPAVNSPEANDRRTFAGFTEVYDSEADFKARVEGELDKMIAKNIPP